MAVTGSIFGTNLRRTVLIVDDDEFMRMLLEDALSERFRVITAASGEKALQMARESNPDVILLDVEMSSGIDGYETCRQLKAGRVGHLIPVIFVSGHDDEKSRQKGGVAGGIDYIIKPFDPSDVLDKVLRALASPAN